MTILSIVFALGAWLMWIHPRPRDYSSTSNRHDLQTGDIVLIDPASPRRSPLDILFSPGFSHVGVVVVLGTVPKVLEALNDDPARGSGVFLTDIDELPDDVWISRRTVPIDTSMILKSKLPIYLSKSYDTNYRHRYMFGSSDSSSTYCPELVADALEDLGIRVLGKKKAPDDFADIYPELPQKLQNKYAEK